MEASTMKEKKKLRFSTENIVGLLVNEKDSIGLAFRKIPLGSKVVLAQGYGVSEKIPLRYLSYAIPVLELRKKLQREFTVSEFYFAENGVLRANPLINQKKIIQNSSDMRKVLSNFVRTFYPDSYNESRFLVDIPLDSQRKNLIDEILPIASGVRENFQSIDTFISRRNGNDSLKYMIEHALYMRDPIMLNGEKLPLLVPEMEQNFDYLFMIGGPAEKIFFNFREKLKNVMQLSLEYKTQQLFTPIGNPPTYNYQEGEPELFGSWMENFETFESQLLSLPSLTIDKRKEIIRDYMVLLLSTSGQLSSYQTSLMKLVSNFRNRSLSPIEQKTLRNGFENLKYFLK